MFVTVLIRSLILNFGITLATELLVALVWKLRKPRELLAVSLVNLITNPPSDHDYDLDTVQLHRVIQPVVFAVF